MEQDGKGNIRSAITQYKDQLLNVDLEAQVVELEGKALDLSATEYGLLACLVRNMGRTLTSTQIQSELWGCQYGDLSSMLTLHVCFLRKKLEDPQHDHQYIRAVWGRGYSFVPTGEN